MQDQEAWDRFIDGAPGGHFLQLWGWAEAKRRFGWEALRVAVLEGDTWHAAAQVLVRSLPVGSFAYLPRGPVQGCNSPLCQSLLFRSLQEHLRKRRAFALKVEPSAGLSPPLGAPFAPSHERLQPHRTLVVDVTDAPDALLARMKPKTRYNIGLARRRGVQVRPAGPEALPVFHALLEETARRQGFAIHSPAYYEALCACLKERAALLVAERNAQPLAAALLVRCGLEATYLYGASGAGERQFMPAYLLQWEAMLWARNSGCSRYDLWGITDQGAEGGDLAGVQRFKSGFGGDAVTHPGAFDLAYRPLQYGIWGGLWPVARRVRRQIAAVQALGHAARPAPDLALHG